MGTGAAVCMLPLSWFIPLWLGGEPTILSNARAYLWFYAMGLPLQALLAVLSAVLRCSGDTRTPLLFNAGTNLLNVCLNYLLIFPSRQVVILGCSLSIWGAGLGVTGAAIGTALSGGLMGISMALFMALRKGPLQMTAVVLFRPQKSVVRRHWHWGFLCFWSGPASAADS